MFLKFVSEKYLSSRIMIYCKKSNLTFKHGQIFIAKDLSVLHIKVLQWSQFEKN